VADSEILVGVETHSFVFKEIRGFQDKHQESSDLAGDKGGKSTRKMRDKPPEQSQQQSPMTKAYKGNRRKRQELHTSRPI
jgi:hypothetical protein